jgi:FKBP-type peptidyl-prolyl cis-trans isomerase FklB
MMNSKLAASCSIVLAALVSWPSVQAQQVPAQDSASRTSASTAPSVASDATGTLKGPELRDLKEKNSYATGVMTIRNLVRNQIAFDPDLIIEGMRDAIAGGAIRLPEKELRLVLQSMQADMQRNLANDRQKDAIRNAQKGEAFAMEFSRKPGAIPVPGGMYYRIIKAGDGDKPRELGTVVVKYRGLRTDGSEFDASPAGKTVTIKLSEVIMGWREVIKTMPAGSTWEVVIPPALAYGNKGNGDRVGPNETLVFEIELVAVVR